jgi:beta-lactam-binding protein with PASTA domain
MTELNLNEALDLAKNLIATDSSGNKWIKIEDLKNLQVEQAQGEMKDEAINQLAPKPKSFAAAKTAASQDPELREAFADRPPVVGPSPTAA